MIRKPDGNTQLSLNRLVPIGLALFLGASTHLSTRPLAAGSISIVPDSGPAGVSVTVTGGGFAPSTMGMIYWEEIPVMTEPPMGSFSTDASGNFLSPVTIMIPSDAAEGGHVIYACTQCTSPEQRIIGSDVYWVLAPVQPTAVPTPTDVPTICDPSGVEGETVIHFDDLVAGATLLNQTIGEIATFRHANPQTISTPLAHSGNIALINHDTGSGYASVLEIELSVVQDFVGVFVGVEGDEGHSFTATLTAWSSLQGGTPIPVASNTVELGPDRQPIEECLAVEKPGEIASITLEYGPRGEVDQPEFIDDLILRGPEDPLPVSPDLSPPIVYLFSPEDGTNYFSEHVLVEGEVREAGFMPRVELLLDGQRIRTLEINRVASGHYRFHYMLGSEETVACGPHTLTIKAIDEEGLEGYAAAGFSYFGAGDLSILSNEAVQVLYGAPLVRDKNTAFRITYLSTFACELEASFQLLLTEDEWNTDFSSSDYPQIWGPVPIAPGPDPQTVMLPYIEPGRANADFDPGFNPAGILRGGQTPSGLTPARRAAPRPIAETVSATVVIDPEDQIVETNEMNNGLHTNWSPTIATRPWNILFIPTHVSADNCSPQLNGMQAPLQLQLEYLLATFPIADDKLSFGIMPAQVAGSCPQGACDWSITAPDAGDGRGQMLTDASRLALMSGYDFGVAVTCGGGGAILGHSTSVFVGRDAGLVTMAHEFNHAVTGMEDIYSLDCFAMWDEAYCELADGSRTYCCQEDGYLIEDGHTGDNCWMDPVSGEAACSVQTKTCAQSCQCSVYRRDAEPNACLEVDASGQYVMPECDVACCWNVCAANCQNGVVYSSPDGSISHAASPGFWVNEWLPAEGLTYIMDIPDGAAFPHKWMRLGNTVQHCNGTAFADGYLNMFASPMFFDPSDPQGLLVSGTIDISGTAEFDPFVILPETYLDIEPGEPGSYEFLLRDYDGNILMSYGFSPEFYRADPNGGPVTQVPFAFRIGWHEDTAFIELRNPNGEVIASRIVSPFVPEVTLRKPNGGETFQQGDPIRIRWEASDVDLSEMAFSLFISNNAGLSWMPLVIDLAENRFTIETNDLELGGSYLIKIMATDGVNTAYDVSDAVFTITDEASKFPLWLIIVGGALGAMIVGAVAWIGATRFLRSRRTTE